jgi:hypothetical protein
MREMKVYLASLPYIEGFKKKLENISSAEGFYEWTLYLIFSMLNVYVRTQVKCAGGRTDMVVWMPDTIYVLELKADGTAEEALRQTDSNGYATAYTSDNRKVIKVGVSFDTKARTINSWIAKEQK